MFDQWMTLVAVAVGPAGIALGWALSEWGEWRRTKEAKRSQEQQERATRGIELLAAAATVRSEGRSLTFAEFLSADGRKPDGQQMAETTARFNAAMSDLERRILEADVFGQDRLADIGRTLADCGRNLTVVVTDLRRDPKAVKVNTVKEALSKFEAALQQATTDVRVLLTGESRKHRIPSHPPQPSIT